MKIIIRPRSEITLTLSHAKMRKLDLEVVNVILLQGLSSLILFFCLCITIPAQKEPIKLYADFKSYKLLAVNYEDNKTQLSLYQNDSKLSDLYFDDMIQTLQVVDFNRDGNPVILAGLYSRGVHCCFTAQLFTVNNNTLTLLASNNFNNSGFAIEDVDKDGRMEVVTSDDRFAYQFGSYTQNRFFLNIYRWENNSLVLANLKFRAWVLKDIEQLKIELERYIENTEVICEDEGERQSMQAILAAITGAYSTLGEQQKGYDIINRYYTCSDKENFISKLENLLAINPPLEKE